MRSRYLSDRTCERSLLVALLGAAVAASSCTVRPDDYMVDGQDVELVFMHSADIHSRIVPYDLDVGDALDVSYTFPVPREMGQPTAADASERRATRRFTVAAIVRQDGVQGGLGRDGLIAGLEDVQEWLDLGGRATSLIATVDPTTTARLTRALMGCPPVPPSHRQGRTPLRCASTPGPPPRSQPVLDRRRPSTA